MSYEGVIDPDSAAALAGSAADAASAAMVRAALSAKAADGSAADAAATLAAIKAAFAGAGVNIRWGGPDGTVLQVLLKDGTWSAGVDLRGLQGPVGPAPDVQVGTVALGTSFSVVREPASPDAAPVFSFVFPAPVPGGKGDAGTSGWSPVLALVADGQRALLQVADWEGGTGAKPAAGLYLAPGGLVASVAAAFDLRGPTGTVTPTFTGTASRAVGQHRVLKADANGLSHASSDDPSSLGCVVGLSVAGAAAGAAITGVISGVVSDPSWSWAPGPVYLGQDGALVQPEPQAGLVQRIGVSDVPTRLIVQVGEPITGGGGVASAEPGLSGTAAVAVAYHQVLRAAAGGLSPASSADLASFGTVVGVSLQGGGVGQAVQYAKGGALSDPSWAWAPGPVFLGPGGTLVQPEPASGIVQRIGVSDLPTRLLVQIDADPLLLTA